MLASDLGADGDPESGRRHWRADRRPRRRSLLPAPRVRLFDLLVEGFYDVTPDHQPILGGVPGLDGLWLAAGFSGHGFMFAPAVGHRLAAGDRRPATPSIPSRAFPGRFSGAGARPELQIV